jgi:hypothetical protein
LQRFVGQRLPSTNRSYRQQRERQKLLNQLTELGPSLSWRNAARWVRRQENNHV